MFLVVLILILGSGYLSLTATGSPAVLLAVSSGVFLVSVFARHISIALPIAAGAGLLTFALALQSYIPWVGVAQGLLLIAWAGAARIQQRPIPAALTAGFFGAMVMSFEIWRGMTGDLINYDLRPYLTVIFAAAGCVLLIPDCIEQVKRITHAAPRRTEAKSRKAFRWGVGMVSLAAIIAITGLLARPMDTLAGHLRDALGGGSSKPEITNDTPTHGRGGARGSSDGARQLPRTADISLDHTFELLIKTDNRADADYLKSGQIYCRTMVFDEYVEDSWLAPEATSFIWIDDREDGKADNQIQLRSIPGDPVRKISYTAFVPKAKEDIVLPTLEGVFQFDLPRVIRIGSSGYGHVSRKERPLSFHATSGIIRLKDLPKASQVPGIAPGPNNLIVPNNNTGVLIENLAPTLARRGDPLPDIINSIKSHLHTNTTYSTVIENPDNLPPLENFLIGERRGYCEFYATAGTLLLRALGVPARVAYGFSGGETTSDPQALAFFTDDGHAWTEVYVKNIGWCAVDFTPEGQGAATPPAPIGPNSPKVDLAEFASLSELDGGIPDASLRARNSTESGYGGLLAAACGLFLCGVITAYLRRPKSTAATSSLGEGKRNTPPPEPGFYRLFCDAAARVGAPKQPGQTPKEHLALLSESKPEEAASLAELVNYYYAVRYEGANVDKGKEKRFRQLVANLG